MKKGIYLILVLFILPLISSAQTAEGIASIKGKLVDNNQIPVAYATVSLLRHQEEFFIGAITDEKGIFNLTEIPLDSFLLEIKYLGFQTIQQNHIFSKQNKKIDLGILTLMEDAKVLEEVVVTAEKSQYSLRLDKKVFTVGEDVLSQGGSAIDVLDQVPLVSVDPSGAVSLRGNSQVQILINGKRSGLTMNNALDQISGDNIQKIEVITNPSASQDASGSAGIVNIILKRERGTGWNGQIRAELGAPANHTLMPGINYKGKKVNFFTNLRWRYSDYNGLYSTDQTTNQNGKIQSLNQEEVELRHDDGRSGYFGADYYLNSKNTITTAFFRAETKDSDLTTLTYQLKEDGNALPDILRTGNSVENRNYNQLETNYTHTTDKKGQRFSIDFQYDFWNSNKDWNLETSGENLPAAIGSKLRTNSEEGSRDFVFQSDFVNPLKENSKIEMGVKLENRIVKNDYIAEAFNDDSWEVFYGIDDDINYSEKIGAAYLQYQSAFKKIEYQVGLRTEYTQVDIDDVDNTFTGNQSYINLFPSAQLSFQLKEHQTLQASYSRRINRPSLWSLFPFSEIVDFNLQQIGNPNLTPAYADGLELGFLTVHDKITISPTLFYKNTQNSFQDFLLQDPNGTFILKPINIDQTEEVGFEVSMKYQPHKAVRLNGEFTYYHFEEKGSYANQSMDVEGQTWSFRINSNFNLPQGIKLQGKFDYRGPQNSAQYKVLSSSILSFGLSKGFLEDRLQISARAFNVLDSRIIRSIYESPEYSIEQSSRRYGRRYGISFLYKINQTARDRMRRQNRENR